MVEVVDVVDSVSETRSDNELVCLLRRIRADSKPVVVVVVEVVDVDVVDVDVVDVDVVDVDVVEVVLVDAIEINPIECRQDQQVRGDELVEVLVVEVVDVVVVPGMNGRKE